MINKGGKKMVKVKNLFMLVIIMGALCLCSKQVKAAETHTEVEPNDTIVQSEQISRNAQTAAQIAGGDFSGKNGVSGCLSNNADVDWYKVVLYSNQDNILDFAITNTTSGSVRLEIYDSNEQLVGNNSFDYAPNTTDRVFRVIIPTTSTYYLKISNTSSDSSIFYGFTIGSPIYLLSSYVETFPSITLSANNFWQHEILFTNNNTIPQDAIVYNVVLDGGTMSSTSKREIRCGSNNTWQVKTMTPWTFALPVTPTYYVRQNWEVRYSAKSKTTTFSPRVVFNYVYPRMPMDEQY